MKMMKALYIAGFILLTGYCSFSAENPFLTNYPVISVFGEDPNHPVYIYPNPVTDGIFTIKGNEILAFEVLNAIGQKVFKCDNAFLKNKEIEIQLYNYQRGMYLVKISFTDGTSTIKKLMVR